MNTVKDLTEETICSMAAHAEAVGLKPRVADFYASLLRLAKEEGETDCSGARCLRLQDALPNRTGIPKTTCRRYINLLLKCQLIGRTYDTIYKNGHPTLSPVYTFPLPDLPVSFVRDLTDAGITAMLNYADTRILRPDAKKLYERMLYLAKKNNRKDKEGFLVLESSGGRLCSSIGVSRRTCIRYLNTLIDRHLIFRKEGISGVTGHRTSTYYFFEVDSRENGTTVNTNLKINNNQIKDGQMDYHAVIRDKYETYKNYQGENFVLKGKGPLTGKEIRAMFRLLEEEDLANYEESLTGKTVNTQYIINGLFYTALSKQNKQDCGCPQENREDYTEEEIKEDLGYRAIVSDRPEQQTILDGIVDIIKTVKNNRTGTVKIGRQAVSIQDFTRSVDDLLPETIEHIIASFLKYPARRPKAYLRSLIYYIPKQEREESRYHEARAGFCNFRQRDYDAEELENFFLDEVAQLALS